MPESPTIGPPSNLDDYDVRLLNDIVLRATTDPDVRRKPFAALYRSYDAILEEHGIDPKHDNIYIRFIARLRRKPRDRDLYEFFTDTLLDFGIQILPGESDADDLSIDRAQVYDPDADEDEDERRAARATHDAPKEQSRGVSRSRRASLSSLDRRGPRHGPDRKRPESRASATQAREDTRPLSPMPGFSKANGALVQPFDLSMLAQASPLPRKNPLEDSPDESAIVLNPLIVRQRSKYSHQTEANPRPVKPNKPDLDPWLENVGLLARHAEDVPIDDLDDDVPLQRPLTEMLRDAHVFQDFYHRERARRALRSWHWLAKMYRNARVLHQTALLAAACRTWSERFATAYKSELLCKALLARSAYVKIRTLYIETSARYEGRTVQDLEQQAEQFRRSYLLGKAFTHWNQCAQDETEKTAAAKSHLTTLRCFQVWKAYATSNETKVRLHVGRKLMSRWLARQAQLDAAAEQALGHREATLLRRMFLNWMWSTREQKAARFNEKFTKKKVLVELLIKLRETRNAEARILDSRRRTLLQSWQRRKADVDSLIGIAAEREVSHSLNNSPTYWRPQGQEVPLERSLISRFDQRTVRNVFSRLVQIFRMQQGATEANRHRLLRSFWDAWNDQLRMQTLAQRVDERILTECLYKWVLAERCVLYQRLRSERLTEQCLRKMLPNTEPSGQALRNAFDRFKEFRRLQQLRLITQWWLEKTHTCQRRRSAASAKDDRRVVGNAFATLQEKHETVQMLETQYVPNFILFYRGKEGLRRLQEASRQSRTRKRHEAYVLVKRRAKQTLCKRYLSKWKDRADELQNLSSTATEEHERKIIALGVGLFDRWRNRTEDLRKREQQAVDDRNAANMHQQLATWHKRAQVIQENDEKALVYDREHSRRAAYRCLRKLHFRIRFIQERQSGTYGVELRQWSQRDLARNLLRLWLERSLRQRGVPEADLPPTAKTRRFKNLLKNLSAQAGPDESIAVPPDTTSRLAEPLVPIPTTPSRRFRRTIRTPAFPLPGQSQAAQAGPQETPAPVPASDARIGQRRAFGQSTAGVRRSLFGSIPERTSFP